MISFKPIWNERAADGRDDGGDARPKVAALVDFKPLWRDDQVSRKFVSAAGGVPLARNEVGAVDSGLVAEQAAAGPLAASASSEPEIAAVAAEHLPENAVATSQLLTREEHERLLAIAREEGVEAGKAQGRAEVGKMLVIEKKKISEFLLAFEQAFGEPGQFIFPLKKLALHLAKEIVRGELQTSGAAITRLVDHCIARAGKSKLVSVHLNAQDLDWFTALQDDVEGGPQAVADESLASGSVKVLLDDGWIEDLIEQRFTDISDALQLD